MTSIGWVAFFFGFGALGGLIAPLFAPQLLQWFPFNFMRPKTREPRVVSFVRIILSAALFGAILSLLGGTLASAVRLL